MYRICKCVALGLCGGLLATFAGSSAADWQQRRLFEPTAAERAAELTGSVFIYDGMKESTVERAMDEAFERVGAMMFVRTVRTDPAGEPLREAATGALLVEEDGCGD